VWRGCRVRRGIPTLSSGHAQLDYHLPGRGWPLGVLTELLSETPGAGEFSLLLPSLATITAKGRWVMLLDPPWVPYAPAMRGHGVALERVMLIRTRSAVDSLWACEQALRGVRGGAVLAWHEDPGFARLRRLQLAAKAGHKAAFLFRPMAAARQASPAALRLQVRAYETGISISILKCRGKHTREAIRIRHSRQLPGFTALPGHVPAGSPSMPVSVPAPREEPCADSRTH
jgi:cell division inhibitor SulA